MWNLFFECCQHKMFAESSGKRFDRVFSWWVVACNSQMCWIHSGCIRTSQQGRSENSSLQWLFSASSFRQTMTQSWSETRKAASTVSTDLWHMFSFQSEEIGTTEQDRQQVKLPFGSDNTWQNTKDTGMLVIYPNTIRWLSTMFNICERDGKTDFSPHFTTIFHYQR